MTLRQFMSTVGYLPATAFSGLVNLVLGSTKKNRKDGSELETPVAKPGLLGLILDGIKYVARSTADFIAEHKKAISVAAWLSLAAAGGTALALFLSPAALTAVVTFSVFGYSIGGIVGANTALQIGFAAGLAGAAASVGTYLTAAVVNTVSAIASYFKNRSAAKKDELPASNDESLSDEELDYIPKTNPSLSALSSQPKATQQTTVVTLVEPQHTTVFNKTATDKKPTVEEKEEISMSIRS